MDFSESLRAASHVGGYAWWYVEAQDADKKYALTLIVFAGSVFSAEYAKRIRLGQSLSGLDVPAVNLALCERRGDAWKTTLWVMNEYPKSALHTSPNSIKVANTLFEVEPDGSVHVNLSEQATKFFGKAGESVHLELRLSPPKHRFLPQLLGASTDGEAHFWQPHSLASSVQASLSRGGQTLTFSGLAYCDQNFGSGRLEHCFSHWSWAHGCSATGDAGGVLYDATSLNGTRRLISVSQHGSKDPEIHSFPRGTSDPRGTSESLADGSQTSPEAPKTSGTDFLWLKVPLGWSLPPLSVQRLPGSPRLDAPFYARFSVSMRDQRIPNELLFGVGEHLNLKRFSHPSLQFLLRYKPHQADR